MSDLLDDIVSNHSGNRTFEEVLNARLSRRAALGGTLAGAAALFLGRSASASGGAVPAAGGARTGRLVAAAASSEIGFTPIPLGFTDSVVVPDGYSIQVIIPWGDPIRPTGPAFKEDASNTSAEQAVQFGMGHDGMHFFPSRGFATNHNRPRGVLAVNHEYTDELLLFPDGKANWTAEKTLKSLHAHGVSVVELELRNGQWRVFPSRLNRRIHGNTRTKLCGPVAGRPIVQTLADPAGRWPLGTLNNCANGFTPWGTYLTCEENFNGYFAATGAYTPDELQARYGLTAAGFGYLWHTTDARFDLSNPASTNEANRFGWVVEINPFNPRHTPVKRTALGRIKREGAALVEGGDGRVVVYSGDDERFEYLYKFVSSGDWRAMRAQGKSPLDHGTAYVAKFNDDGTGEWLPLVWNHGPLTRANGFGSQAQVLVKARLAGDALGATPMDRPEWTSVGPDGTCWVTLTNNTARTAAQVDAPNPRGPNPWGHIIRWRDSDNHLGTTFEWDIFLLAGPGGGVDGSTIDPEDAFGSPDGLLQDPNGRLWIQTDGSQPTGANNQMLAADPATGDIRRFLTGPLGCEVTGMTMTPDHRTLFANIQHPGEGVPSTWPSGAPGARPRPATVVITKDDGGVIGT
jgi:secreted PhoX family phosphatase